MSTYYNWNRWFRLCIGIIGLTELPLCGGRRPPLTDAVIPVATPSASTTTIVNSTTLSTTSEILRPKSPWAIETISALITTPDFEDVEQAFHKKNFQQAATLIQQKIQAKNIIDKNLPRAHFLRGQFLNLGGDEAAAEQAYAQVEETSPLYNYATIRRASFFVKTARYDDAIALLSKIQEPGPLENNKKFLFAEALAGKKDPAAVAEFASLRTTQRWAEAATRFAEEIILQTNPSEQNIIEAIHSLRRIRFEAPTSTWLQRAQDAEEKIKIKFSKQANLFKGPSIEESVQLAQAYFDAGQSLQSIRILKALAPTLKKEDSVWCRAHFLLAKSQEKNKKKQLASEIYGNVADACSEEAVRVHALYDGAKIATSLKMFDMAQARFATVEKSFPNHRLADDARYRGALAAIENNELEKGEAMLASLPDDYPKGDRKTEALFRLALPRMLKKDWVGAIPYLEKSRLISPIEEGYFVAGRATYFLGRAKLEMGETKVGLEHLRAVITQAPLSFAAAMAYSRLAKHSKEEAKNAQNIQIKAMESEAKGEFLNYTFEELNSKHFARGVELARVQEWDWARKEFTAAGLFKEKENSEKTWLVAAILARTGDIRTSHNLTRNRLTDWAQHFPSGRWKQAWQIAFPQPYAPIVQSIAQREAVPAELLWAVMREESAFDPEATSHAAAYGLLQLIAPTAAHYAKPRTLPFDRSSLYQPAINIQLGAIFLHELRNEFASNVALAVPSYNAGKGRTRRWMNPPLADSFDLWVEAIPFDETRAYTKRVLTSYYAYVALHAPERLDEELRTAAGVN